VNTANKANVDDKDDTITAVLLHFN